MEKNRRGGWRVEMLLMFVGLFGLVWFGWVELVGWLVLVVCHLGAMDWIN